MANENTVVQAAPPKLAVKACLPFTLKPVPPGDTAAALLPRQALASAPLARVVSLYRQLLAEALGTVQAGDHAGMGSVVGDGLSMVCSCHLHTRAQATLGLPACRAPPRLRPRPILCWPVSRLCWMTRTSAQPSCSELGLVVGASG